MAGIVWIVICTTGSVWAVSTLFTAALAVRAHRGDPRVVIDDPWETEKGQRDLARLREAVSGAHEESLASRRPRSAA